MTIDAIVSQQALDEALKQFPEFSKFQPRVEWRPLMKGGAFVVAYRKHPPKNFPNTWDFQNSYVKGYKRLTQTS